jgi:hypothetical protein
LRLVANKNGVIWESLLCRKGTFASLGARGKTLIAR